MNQEDDSDELFYQNELVRHTRVSELITLWTRGEVFLLIEVGAHKVLQTLEISRFIETAVNGYP